MGRKTKSSVIVRIHVESDADGVAVCRDVVTRQTVRTVAEEAGYHWSEDALTVDGLKESDEVWICSSVREILAVTDVDGTQIGEGVPGSVYREVLDRYREHVTAETRRDAGIA